MAPEIDKLPPYSQEAEQAVLGAMLLDKDAIIIGGELLREDDFYRDAHRLIFQAVKGLEQEGQTVDMVTVTEALRQKDALDKCGGMSFLASLANMVPTAAGIRHYAKIVRDKALLRRLIRVTGEFQLRGYEEPEDVYGLIGQAEQAIFEISQGQASQGLLLIRDMLPAMVTQIEALSKRPEGITGIPSYFTALDRFTSGWQPSDLVILAARPSMGKTAFALNLAENAAVRYKAPVALFSLEMSREQLLIRLISSRADIEQTVLRNGRLKGDEWEKLVEAAAVLSQAPIYIDDTPGITVAELRSRARRLKAERELSLILVDYLQLMQGDRRSGENRQQEISEISRSLKALARELKVPVIALSQLSREVEKTGDKRPGLSHLRESGALEQDADLVMFIFREEYYDKNTENPGIAEIIVAKHRNGPVGTVELGFEDRVTRFYNLRERPGGGDSGAGD
ncbi:MAG: replicative DNA helicase [Peptococcaceae bacterium]|jgi:replicative DNA helicase|nr:replicative DNA helicase [Peptococcaceae bacterium]